jgi:hypothetical protein
MRRLLQQEEAGGMMENMDRNGDDEVGILGLQVACRPRA